MKSTSDMKKLEELIWMSNHLIKKWSLSEALQAVCGSSQAEPRNRSRALQEMNLFKSKVAGQAIKVRLEEILRGMSQGRVHAQIPCRPRYQEELPACRPLLNNVQGVE